MSNDWLVDMLDGKPSGITDTQWLIIESNIDRTCLPSHYVDDILRRLNHLTELEAEEIINLINENKIETDTRKQWIRMLKDGVFES